MKISIKKAHNGDTFSSLEVGCLFISRDIPDQLLIKLVDSKRSVMGYTQHYNVAQVGGTTVAKFFENQPVQRVTSIQVEVQSC